ALDVDCIIASESLRSLDDYLALCERCAGSGILSLDFTEHGYRGPAALLENPALWPASIIAMTLAKVGSNAGPDQHKLAQIMGTSNRQIYAAGGVRDIDDLRMLKHMGIHGALVASALHAGNLTGAEIETL
ncbi:MAG TPA: HisA/HisF-related TIM barrel protein, partial [Methylophilaceae bacterium]|nr:HisA/HisF-related TIM barrel protein [Methylophilaceae bacterium]